MTHERFEPRRIEIVFLLIDFTLYDSWELIFDRILEGDDFTIGGIEGRHHRVECCRLSRSSGTGHEEGSIFFLERFIDLSLTRPHEPEITDGRDRFRRVEDTTDSIFAITHWEGRDTDVDTIPISRDTVFPILRNFSNIELEI